MKLKILSALSWISLLSLSLVFVYFYITKQIELIQITGIVVFIIAVLNLNRILITWGAKK